MGVVTPAACPLGSGICLILLYIAVLPIDGVVRAARDCGRVVWSAVARPVECSWLTVHKVGGQKIRRGSSRSARARESEKTI